MVLLSGKGGERAPRPGFGAWIPRLRRLTLSAASNGRWRSLRGFERAAKSDDGVMTSLREVKGLPRGQTFLCVVRMKQKQTLLIPIARQSDHPATSLSGYACPTIILFSSRSSGDGKRCGGIGRKKGKRRTTRGARRVRVWTWLVWANEIWSLSSGGEKKERGGGMEWRT
jgi:hypothetical protein